MQPQLQIKTRKKRKSNYFPVSNIYFRFSNYILFTPDKRKLFPFSDFFLPISRKYPFFWGGLDYGNKMFNI